MMNGSSGTTPNSIRLPTTEKKMAAALRFMIEFKTIDLKLPVSPTKTQQVIALNTII
jgi:hypothetical protein